MRQLTVALAMVAALTACSAPAATPVGSAAFTTAAPNATLTPSPAVATQHPPTPIPLLSFAHLSAPTDEVVWALVAGDHLFRSSDRGATWEPRPTPLGSPFREGVGFAQNMISFVDESQGWLLKAFQPGTGCQQQGYELWHTVDAGSSWHRLATAPISGLAIGGPLFGMCKRSIAFSDGLRGVVVAVARDLQTSVYSTIDGGTTWSIAPLPEPGFTPGAGYGVEPGNVRWFGSTVLLAARGRVGGEPRRFVFRSTDAGATWAHVADAPVNGAIAFVTRARWVQIALPSSHEETTDAGATWHRFHSDYSQAAGVEPQVIFGGEYVGYATVRGFILRTMDGGASWTSVKTPGT